MAGADYIHCSSGDPNCKGRKLVYAGGIDYEDRPVIFCEYCYRKLEAKILKLTKDAKRGR
jgi:hypothetical protein